MKQFHLRASDDLYTRLTEFAKKDNRSITAIVRMAIEAYISKEK